MIRKIVLLKAALAVVLAGATACGEKEQVDRTPMPVTAQPPYLCEYIPLRAVELMTGVRDPLVRGEFDMSLTGGPGIGGCAIYRRTGDRDKVLDISLSSVGNLANVEEQLRGGASPLPEILPGSRGYYFQSDTNATYAMLVQGEATVNIQLLKGVKGRDNMADVLALMRLIAPKLITEASAPSTTPSPATKG